MGPASGGATTPKVVLPGLAVHGTSCTFMEEFGLRGLNGKVDLHNGARPGYAGRRVEIPPHQ